MAQKQSASAEGQEEEKASSLLARHCLGAVDQRGQGTGHLRARYRQAGIHLSIGRARRARGSRGLLAQAAATVAAASGSKGASGKEIQQWMNELVQVINKHIDT